MRGEIRKGLALFPQSNRRTRLEFWLESDLKPRFAGRILDVNGAVADRWGTLAAQAKAALRVVDRLLAATAIEYNLTLLSRNISDFRDAPVTLFNPGKVKVPINLTTPRRATVCYRHYRCQLEL